MTCVEISSDFGIVLCVGVIIRGLRGHSDYYNEIPQQCYCNVSDTILITSSHSAGMFCFTQCWEVHCSIDQPPVTFLNAEKDLATRLVTITKQAQQQSFIKRFLFIVSYSEQH